MYVWIMQSYILFQPITIKMYLRLKSCTLYCFTWVLRNYYYTTWRIKLLSTTHKLFLYLCFRLHYRPKIDFLWWANESLLVSLDVIIFCRRMIMLKIQLLKSTKLLKLRRKVLRPYFDLKTIHLKILLANNSSEKGKLRIWMLSIELRWKIICGKNTQ